MIGYGERPIHPSVKVVRVGGSDRPAPVPGIDIRTWVACEVFRTLISRSDTGAAFGIFASKALDAADALMAALDSDAMAKIALRKAEQAAKPEEPNSEAP